MSDLLKSSGDGRLFYLTTLAVSLAAARTGASATTLAGSSAEFRCSSDAHQNWPCEIHYAPRDCGQLTEEKKRGEDNDQNRNKLVMKAMTSTGFHISLVLNITWLKISTFVKKNLFCYATPVHLSSSV